MAVADGAGGVATLSVVYYGPPGAGKTTNLERISALIHGHALGRITPRQLGGNRIASMEIPEGSLGRLLGSRVVVRLETIQGDASSDGGGWAELLAGADGIVLVADSSPHARSANLKALAGIRERLEGRGRSAAAIPVLLQWNKRDRADARPIAEMETELNHRCFPSIEAAALRGTGVAETLIEILKKVLGAAQRRAGETVRPEAEQGQSIAAAIQRLSKSAREASIERFGATIDRQPSAWPEAREPASAARDRDGIWSREAVYSAESIGGGRSGSATTEHQDRAVSDSATRMLATLEWATWLLRDRELSGLPRGLMAGLLAGCDRTRGSLLLFRQGAPGLDEGEVVPPGADPLNALRSTTGGATAATLCAGGESLFIGGPAGDVSAPFIVPGAEQLQGALVVPLTFRGQAYGGMVVYVAANEQPPTAAERSYWRTAAACAGAYFASGAGEQRVGASRRMGTAPRPDRSDVLDV